MALFRFVEAIEHGHPISAYGRGAMSRDFTYIDDLVEAVVRLTGVVPRRGNPQKLDGGAIDSLSPVAPWRVVNIGSGNPVRLSDFIAVIERTLGKTATNIPMPMQAGDVVDTFADISLLKALTGFSASTSLTAGVDEFVRWYAGFAGAGRGASPPQVDDQRRDG
jgi:UDP-glucuronate 4-epimerase